MPWIDRCVNFRHLPRLHGGLLLDAVLPDRCVVCGSASDRAGYCRGCASELPRHERQCRRCAVPVIGGDVCGRCQRRPPPVIEAIAPFQYASPLSDAIHKLKYHRQLACGRDLGILLAGELGARATCLPDALVPVPLHWKRRFRRGFNQSLELARPVGLELGIPIDPRLVARLLPTAPQVGLKPVQRRRNLRGAFHCRGRAVPASVAIVDDVITSGSTVLEVARCLRRAGVRRISVWALARA